MTDFPAPRPRSDSARARRAASAVGVAAVSTVVAAVAHATAGGGWPNLVTLVAALAISSFLTLPLVGARVRSWRLALAVAVDQLVFHLLFATVGAATALPLGTGHHHGELSLLVGTETTAAGLGMGAHHAVAGAVSFTLLRGGWALIVGAIAAGAERLLRPLRGIRLSAPAPRSMPARAVRTPLLVVLMRGMPRRGPPAAAALG